MQPSPGLRTATRASCCACGIGALRRRAPEGWPVCSVARMGLGRSNGTAGASVCVLSSPVTLHSPLMTKKRHARHSFRRLSAEQAPSPAPFPLRPALFVPTLAKEAPRATLFRNHPGEKSAMAGTRSAGNDVLSADAGTFRAGTAASYAALERNSLGDDTSSVVVGATNAEVSTRPAARCGERGGDATSAAARTAFVVTRDKG